MASPLFVDTSFWIALLKPNDSYHARVMAWRIWLQRESSNLVSTEAVWWELMNGLAHPATRGRAIESYRRAHAEPKLEIVPFGKALTESASNLYGQRLDKDWSLTDCLSFVVMEQRGIRSALTTDRHFEQAGFEALLRREPHA